MQLLTFSVSGHAYAIESRQVIEVLPVVAARPIPHTPDYVRGIFTYRGRLVPLIDLGLRLAAGSLADRLSTRVIVVAIGDRPGGPGLLGLVAENVISICSSDQVEASLPPLDVHDAPFLGRILRIGGRTIQMIAADRLLPSDVSTGLYSEAAAVQP